MTKEELKEHCLKTINHPGVSEKPKEEHKLILELFDEIETLKSMAGVKEPDLFTPSLTYSKSITNHL